MWARSKTDGFDGHYTRLRDCTTTPIAPDVVVLASIGHELALFMDTFDDTTRAGSLRTLGVGNGNTLQTETRRRWSPTTSTATPSPAPPPARCSTPSTPAATADGVYVRWFGP